MATNSNLKNDFLNLRFSQFAPAPYYFITTESFAKVAHNAGITFNVIPNRIHNAKNYSIGSAISLGYNLINSAKKDNQRFIFLSGSFSFGDLKKPDQVKSL